MSMPSYLFCLVAAYLLVAGSATAVDFQVSSSEGESLIWTQWSVCSRTCGGGTQVRRRVCDESLDPQTCQYVKSLYSQAELRETQACSTQSCLVTGTWSDWYDWQPCSSTCGTSAYQLRFRSCTDENDTDPTVQPHCEGPRFESRPCGDLEPCPDDRTAHLSSGDLLESFSSFRSVVSNSEEEELESNISSSSFEP